jgi:hypothetical protein
MDVMPTGWVRDPEATELITEQLGARGPVYPCDVPGLKGYANEQINRGIYCVLSIDTDRQALGDVIPVKNQLRGTCTDQSGSHALSSSWNAGVALDQIVGVPLVIPSGPQYALTWRHSPGRYGSTHPYSCRCSRCPDGEAISHYAYVAATVGILGAGTYGEFDLTKDREDLGIAWCVNGVPQSILDAAAAVKCSAYRVKSLDDLNDCLWARKFGHQGCGYTFDGHDGDYARLVSLQGGLHAEAILGAFVDVSGEIGYVRRNSWKGRPKGPYQIKVRDGRVIPLPPGYYPVRKRDMQRVLADGETWVYGFRQGSGWRSRPVALAM